MNELNTMRYKNGNKLKLNSSMKIIKKYMLSLVVITTILVGCGVSIKQDSGSMSSVEMSIVEKESTERLISITFLSAWTIIYLKV